MSTLGEFNHYIIHVNEHKRISDLSNLKKENTILKDEIELLKMINASVETENTSLLEAIEALKEDNSVLANCNRILEEELEQLRVTCDDKDNELVATKEKLLQEQKRNEELEVRLKKDSTTSSKPPSTDQNKKPKRPMNKRKKSGKETGGQHGHEGHTLEKVDNPDVVVDNPTDQECDCGCDLSQVEGKTTSRQVYDIPVVTIEVTEYRTHEKDCPNCGKKHKTEFPEEVKQSTQYGDSIKSLMVYLTNYQLIPLARSVEMIEDLTDHKVSQGTLVNTGQQVHDTLEVYEEIVKERLINAEVVHFDETSARCESEKKWTHSASTENLTFYALHDKRGKAATEDIGILPHFTGTAIHDHWATYYSYKGCSHGECNSHILRALENISENHKQDWAEPMSELLLEIKSRVDTLKAEGLTAMPKEEMVLFTTRYHSIIEEGKKEDDIKSAGLVSKKTGKPKNSEARNLLNRLYKYDIETLSFMYDFNIPFDNNLALC